MASSSKIIPSAGSHEDHIHMNAGRLSQHIESAEGVTHGRPIMRYVRKHHQSGHQKQDESINIGIIIDHKKFKNKSNIEGKS